MRIEEGKTYKTRDGRMLGPGKSHIGRFEFDGDFDSLHEADGTYCGTDRGLDIISEWPEGPIRTVTRQEIIPGTYDGVVVSYEHDHRLTVHFMVERPAPDALIRAAAVLTALAGALRDAS